MDAAESPVVRDCLNQLFPFVGKKIIVTSVWRGFFALSKKEKKPNSEQMQILLLKSLQMAEDR